MTNLASVALFSMCYFEM